MIWFGDLNYRVALSYQETRSLLRNNDWNSLLERDQVIHQLLIYSFFFQRQCVISCITVEDRKRSRKGVQWVEGREDLICSNL